MSAGILAAANPCLQQPAQIQHSKMGRRLAQPVAAIVQQALLGQMTKLLPAPLLRSRTHLRNCEATPPALHVQLKASARRAGAHQSLPDAASLHIHNASPGMSGELMPALITKARALHVTLRAAQHAIVACKACLHDADTTKSHTACSHYRWDAGVSLWASQTPMQSLIHDAGPCGPKFPRGTS